MKLIRFATNALSTKKWGSNTPISPASLPSRAGALFSCRLSSFWQSAGLQNHRPLVRIHPHENPNFLQTENRQRISTLAVFLWARVDYASRAAKNSPLGCFCPFFCDGAAAVRIHPPSLWEGYYKTETPVPGSDTGVLGGRGWIRTSSTITIRWMRFEIVMDSCAFFEFHQKSIIGYHNHLGTKTGYKVGCFARGEYSARASETAIAAVSALPSTAWLYQP